MAQNLLREPVRGVHEGLRHRQVVRRQHAPRQRLEEARRRHAHGHTRLQGLQLQGKIRHDLRPHLWHVQGHRRSGRRPPPVLRTAARIPPGQGRRRVDHEAPRPGRLRRISSHCYTTSIGTVIDLRAASNKEGSPPRRPR